jgi:hypothetical protein
MNRLLLLLITLLFSLGMFAQTTGQMSFTVTTSNAGGSYAPKNIVAVWITDNSDNFVKTIFAYTGAWKTHLNTWQAASNYNVADASTGATYTSHTTRSYTWNGKNTSGTIVPDGTYKLWIELTDKNATGRYTSISFVKGASSQSLNPANVPSFSSMSLSWTPDLTAVSENSKQADYSVFPNPTTGIFTISGDAIQSVEILNITGNSIKKQKDSNCDISDLPAGVYFVKIKHQGGSVTRKLFKN